jgi:hypothetical protein
MANEFLELTRPSLQWSASWPLRYVAFAEHDCVQHTSGAIFGICASSLDCVASMPSVLAPGCAGSPDQFAIFGDAIACGARVGNLALNSKIAPGLEGVVEMAGCTLRTASSP